MGHHRHVLLSIHFSRARSKCECICKYEDMIARYGKPVITAEVGMDVNEAALRKKCSLTW